MYGVRVYSWSGLSTLCAWRVETYNARVSADMRFVGFLVAASATTLRIFALQAYPCLLVLISVPGRAESFPRYLQLTLLAKHSLLCPLLVAGFPMQIPAAVGQ